MDPHLKEIYFMILRTLEGGPFPEAATLLRRELEKEINDTRLDYLGQPHSVDLNHLLANYPHINSHTLVDICKNLKQFLDINDPPPTTYKSLLCTGQYSLLRNKKLKHYDSINHSIKSLLSTKLYGPAYKNQSINMIRHLQARKLRGPVCIRRTTPPEIYSRIHLYRKLMGHLSSVYCVTFDHSGQYIITGADDHLIKIWSARDGRLLKTLRGHSGQITDMSVNFENRLLASGGMDRIVRIWDLKTSKLLECLNAHSAMVTSVKFAPYNRHGNDRYLISTSNDGSVIFWAYDADKFGFTKLKKFQERNRPGGQIICSSFSTGGSFLACGSSDNFIHVYGFHPECGPYPLKEIDFHRDKVDSIQFANLGYKFITGSQDGTAVIWNYERGAWKPKLRLDMNTQLNQTIPQSEKAPKLKSHIVQWSRDDRFVLTSMVDYSIKVWDASNGRLLHIMKEHQNSCYTIESHPTDPRIVLSASWDGTMIIWDIENAKVIKRFQNRVTAESSTSSNPISQLASIYDVKWSPDGNMLAATDSHGYLSLYGNGSAEPYKELPEQVFFHTDYRPLIRDIRQFVMDEQSHLAPHLMPRPTLVDMNGNPYPSQMQRFVPDYKDGERVVVKPLSDAQLKIIAEVIDRHSQQEDDEYLKEKESPADDLMERSGPSNIISMYPGRSCNNRGGENSRYNTRYSTRSSFRSARRNFSRARRTRQRYIEDEEDDDEGGGSQQPSVSNIQPRSRQQRMLQRQRMQQQQQQQQLQQQQQQQQQQRQQMQHRQILETTEDDDSSTEEDDDETIEDTEEESTEIDTDEETVIDSDATEIDDTSRADMIRQPQTPARPVRRTRSSANSSLNLSREQEQRVTRRCSERLRDRKRVRRS